MSKVQSLHHIIINTKHRHMTIPDEHKKELYAYIYGIIKNKKCTLLRMNGISNHIHMLVDLHPSVSLSALVSEIKRSSSLWLKDSEKFPFFQGWGKEYCAMSKSDNDKNTIIEYIKNQEKHHISISYEDEMIEIYRKRGEIWKPEQYD